MANTRNPDSKMSKARVIVNEGLALDNPPARKDVITRLMTEVNLTKAGAATYYQKLRKDYLAG